MTNDPPAIPSTSGGPLAGLTVLDLTRMLAGPYCTLMLADLGARVIKVEMPEVGDDARHIGPFFDDGDGRPTSAYFFSVNRNKESIALDLKSDRDRQILEALLARSDILVENFTPGALERLGYGWPVLHERYPRLIVGSISGFGQTGPYRTLPAYDMVVQAMGGILSLTGEEGGAPTRVGVSIGDLAAGLFAAIGLQAALVERQRTGLGRHVDVSMLDAQVSLLENALARCQVEGQVPGPIGSRHPSVTPFGVFAARDGSLVLAAGNDSLFIKLCRAIGIAGASDEPRFKSNALRCRHHAELKELIELRLSTRTVADWLAHFRERGIPSGPLNDVGSVLRDPHVQARGMLMNWPLADGRTLATAACPIQFGDGPLTRAEPAPHLDQHRADLLRELGLG